MKMEKWRGVWELPGLFFMIHFLHIPLMQTLSKEGGEVCVLSAVGGEGGSASSPQPYSMSGPKDFKLYLPPWG